MQAPNKDNAKAIVVLCVGLFLLLLSAGYANAIPTAEDINSLAEAAEQTTKNFMQESFELRMQYEYSGKFLGPKDEDTLHILAKKAGSRLTAIAEKQRKLKKQIEDYEGSDWDSRYGLTGLWRKLFADLYTTNLSKCEIELYCALTAQPTERIKILHTLLTQIDSLEQTHHTVYAQFLRARTLALLARIDLTYKPLVKKEFDSLGKQTATGDLTAYRIEIEKIKLFGLHGPNRLKMLAENIAKSKCADDIELVLSVAFLQHRYDPEGLEQTSKLFPQTQDFLGSLTLSDLSYRLTQNRADKQALEQVSVFEAELAARAAWKNNPQEYKTLLEDFAGIQKFQTPLILYVTAVALADSSPTKAVYLLIKASKLQQSQKSGKLDIQAWKIAQQAAQLAYNSFAKDLLDCEAALGAFENYRTIAKEKVDEELEYHYVRVLDTCGLTKKAKKLLQKIADRSAGKYRNKARLGLIVQALKQSQVSSRSQSFLMNRLRKLISDCTAKNEQQTRAKAIIIYCRTLLELKNRVCAQEVLNILAKVGTIRDPNLNVFKSEALRRLGRLDESVDCLVFAIAPSSCEHAGEAMGLLTEIIDKIDSYQADRDTFSKMVQNCYKLADFCYNCFDGRQKQLAGLLLVEVSIFAAEKEKGKLSAAEKLLNNLAGGADNVNLLRCRARLLAEQGQFEKAAQLWAKICRIRKGESASINKRSWKWWRAKYYELACWAKCPQSEKENIVHTIDVLKNSFAHIPPLWTGKLDLLRQQIDTK